MAVGADPQTDPGNSHEDELTTAGRRAAKRAAIRRFDFRRPSKFSRDNFRAFQIVHETFARQMTTVFSTTLRAVSQVTLLDVDQVAYGEYIEDLPNPTFLPIFQLAPLPGASLFHIPLPIVMSCVERLLGGTGAHDKQDPRALTDIEAGLMRDLTDRLLRELSYAFETVYAVQASIAQLESNPQFAQIAATTDMMLVIRLEVRIGDVTEIASICIPYDSLSIVLETLTNNHFTDRPARDTAAVRNALAERVLEVPLDVTVDFNPITLTSREIVDMQVGDVLPLDHNVKDPLTVLAAGHPHLHAMPGRRGKRLAAQIVDSHEGRKP